MSDVLSIARFADVVRQKHPIGTAGKADSAAGLDKPVHPCLHSNRQHNRKESKMETADRIDTFINTLREAHKVGLPSGYDSDNPADKLITITGNVSDLCWCIAVTDKQSDPAVKTSLADSIKHDATNIINICITGLENLGHTTEHAIELIATDGALWFWNLPLRPLNTLDQDTPPIDRIQSPQISTGHLTEWWPNMISPQNEADLNAERERAFINLAYEAACATIAHNH